MAIPEWLYIVVACWVLGWGLYRVSFVFRRKQPVEVRSLRTKGLFATNTRRHLLYGILYIILGVYLLAVGLGYRFL